MRDTNTDTPIPPDEPTAKNPPDGAIVDYFLAQSTQGPITLEILDAQSKVVRRYASTDKPDLTEEELARQLIPPYWVRMPRILSATAGMHRWVWNLHYTTPLSTRSGYPIAAVPGDTPREPQGPERTPRTIHGSAHRGRPYLKRFPDRKDGSARQDHSRGTSPNVSVAKPARFHDDEKHRGR